MMLFRTFLLLSYAFVNCENDSNRPHLPIDNKVLIGLARDPEIGENLFPHEPVSTAISMVDHERTYDLSWSDLPEDLALLVSTPCNEIQQINVCVAMEQEPGTCLTLISTHSTTDNGCYILYDGAPGMTYIANSASGMISKTLQPLTISNLHALDTYLTWKNPVTSVYDSIQLCAVGPIGVCHTITSSTTESYNFTHLIPGASYTITAQVFSNGVGSDVSIIDHTLKPLKISNLNASDSYVTWKNPASSVYDAIRLCAVGPGGTCKNISSSTTESYNFTHLVPGASYTITAQVFSNGLGSDVFTIYHKLKPLPVSNLNAENSCVTWKNPMNTDFDTIRLCVFGPFGACYNITDNSAEFYNFTNLVPGAFYELTAQVFSNGTGSDVFNINHTFRSSCENKASLGFCQAKHSLDNRLCDSDRWRDLCCDFCHTITSGRPCKREELPLNVCKRLALNNPELCTGFMHRHSQLCCAYCGPPNTITKLSQ